MANGEGLQVTRASGEEVNDGRHIRRDGTNLQPFERWDNEMLEDIETGHL